MIQMNGEKFQVSILIKSIFNFSFSHRLFLMYALIFPHRLFLKFFHEPRTDRPSKSQLSSTRIRRSQTSFSLWARCSWQALGCSAICKRYFSPSFNKTANNHKRNDIYIQPNQTEEACVCVQVMVVIRSVSRWAGQKHLHVYLPLIKSGQVIQLLMS